MIVELSLSIKHSYNGEWNDDSLDPSACSEVRSGHMDLDMKKKSSEMKEIIWTYGVFWEVTFFSTNAHI